MKSSLTPSLGGFPLLFLLLFTWAATLAGQTPARQTHKLTGTVKDPSDAAMAAVDVSILQMIQGNPRVLTAAKTDALGVFSFDLPAGEYRLAVTAPDFDPHNQPVRVGPNMQAIAVTLLLKGLTTSVEVVATNRVVVDAAQSLNATTITPEQLSALPEDEESLLAFLQVLAGGEGNAQLVIDGFEGGKMPTRDQIAQIVIEPNSFNANGTGPRITVVSRQPGPTRWTGSANFQFRDSSLNARTPHALNKPQTRRSVLNTNYSGPVIKGKLGMTFNLSKQQSDSGGGSISAVTANGPINHAYFSPSTYDNFGITQNWYLPNTHSLLINLNYNRGRYLNQGIGNFNLEERAYDSHDDGWTLQVTDNKPLSPKMTNNFNFRFYRTSSRTMPRTQAIAINVLDAFNGGGAQNRSESTSSNFNLGNVLRWQPNAKWNFQFAVNANRNSNYALSESNYLGTFTFSSLEDYLAGRALTFSQTTGNPIARVAQSEANVSVQATYRIKPTISYSAGVQYMVQEHLKDYNNFSPTSQIQFQVKQKSTISIGARLTHQVVNMFYYEQLIRGDGTTKQFTTVISNPSYPDPFSSGDTGTTSGGGSSRQVRDRNFVAPSTFNAQVSLNQTLPRNWRFNASFNLNRGIHQIRNRNINAPYPGTPLDPNLSQDEINLLRPFYPYVGRIFQSESTGSSFSKNLSLLVQVPPSSRYLRTTVQGTFQYNATWAEDDGTAQNPYNIRADWARNDQRHRFTTSFSIRPPKVGQFSLNMTASSGRAYSITSGRDDNFDQSINDRPQGVKRNSLRGPGSYVVNLNYTSPAINIRKQKAPTGEAPTGAAGVPAGNPDLIQSALNAGLSPAMIQQLLSSMSPQPAPGGTAAPSMQPTLLRPQITFSASVQNLLNNTRIQGYGGVITSPLFGRPTGYLPGRQIMVAINTRF